MTDTARQQKSRHCACLCAHVADELRGTDTCVLDLTQVTPIADYFVLSTAASRRQMHAIADEVDRVMQAEGSGRIGVEGYQGDSWILQDYGDVVLHVFNSQSRALYDLEHLWADASKVDWKTIIGAHH